MVDVIKAACNIRVQDVLGFAADKHEDCPDRIVAGPARSESVAVWLKLGFPFRFQGLLGNRLLSPIADGRDAKWSFLLLAGFRFQGLLGNRLLSPIADGREIG